MSFKSIPMLTTFMIKFEQIPFNSFKILSKAFPHLNFADMTIYVPSQEFRDFYLLKQLKPNLN